MITVHDILRDRLLTKAGVKLKIQPDTTIDLVLLKKSEWSLEFEELMRNRLIMGFFRYGPFNKQNRDTIPMIQSIIKRSKQYLITGNDELLVDIANLAMKEFAVGKHPKKHFKSIDDGEHV